MIGIFPVAICISSLGCFEHWDVVAWCCSTFLLSLRLLHHYWKFVPQTSTHVYWYTCGAAFWCLPVKNAVTAAHCFETAVFSRVLSTNNDITLFKLSFSWFGGTLVISCLPACLPGPQSILHTLRLAGDKQIRLRLIFYMVPQFTLCCWALCFICVTSTSLLTVF